MTILKCMMYNHIVFSVLLVQAMYIGKKRWMGGSFYSTGNPMHKSDDSCNEGN